MNRNIVLQNKLHRVAELPVLAKFNLLLSSANVLNREVTNTKMTKEEAIKYKDYPEGSLSKRTYDRFFIPFRDFLVKYYKDVDLKRWDYINSKFVSPLFDGTPAQKYQDDLRQIKPSFFPDASKCQEFWQLIKDDLRFDTDLKQFFSFLYAIDFYQDKTFEEWLKIDYWNHPWYSEESENRQPIVEILNLPYGLNYLKSGLAELSVFN